jgi:hypothetical protein
MPDSKPKELKLFLKNTRSYETRLYPVNRILILPLESRMTYSVAGGVANNS